MAIRNDLLRDILSAIGGGGAVQWGSVGGNILDQADLQAQFEDTVPLNSKVINSESDFETQDATTITLNSGVHYQLGANISTSKRFIAQGAVLEGLSTATTLTYTGTGSMFTNTNNTFRIINTIVDCPSATVFECIGDDSGNPDHRVNADSLLVLNCVKLLTSTGAGAQVFDLMQVSNMTGSVAATFSGSTAALVYSFSRISFIGMTAGSTGYDFGTSLALEVELTNCIMLGDATATAVSGATSSANIASGNLGMVSNCNFAAFTNQLSGIDVEDVRWDFKSNASLSDSIDDALIHTSNNALETTITTQNVRVKVNAVFVVDALGRFASDGTGRLDYVGEKTTRLPVDVSATILAASGGDKQVDLCIAINGAVIAATCVQATASGSKATAIATIWQHVFIPGDYVEIYVSNDTNTVNLIVTQAILRIN